MNSRSPSSARGHSGGYPAKRIRHSPSEDTSPTDSIMGGGSHSNSGPATSTLSDPSPPDDVLVSGTATHGGKAGQSSSFRNVSACNRCRLRKNRCDQRLPSCASCEKAKLKCVGYDPITKREIPRSYVFYLETRVNYLENLLHSNGISFAPADVLDLASRPGADPTATQQPLDDAPPHNGSDIPLTHNKSRKGEAYKKQDESEKINKLASNLGMATVRGGPDTRHLGSTSGVSFARVVFAAVKSSVSNNSSEKGGVRPSKPSQMKTGPTGGTTMRDSFFGLQTKPTIKQAPFPDRDLGFRLANIYFEYANPQVPILHRGEFMKMFDEVYADPNQPKTARQLYMCNIVFAIGSGIFLGEADSEENTTSPKADDTFKKPAHPSGDANKSPHHQCQPEEYHAAAIVHLEACLASSSTIGEKHDGFGGGLEELQAVLLLAGFALLRPVAPGLWYIIGVAIRLAVDLGLHYEDGKDIDTGLDDPSTRVSLGITSDGMDADKPTLPNKANERGRREWIRDLRRRLWWCTYSLDRLVSTCVGRPFGISDQVITTEFPSLLEDKYITREGFLTPPGGPSEPSYKHVAYHYFRLRLMQSEILQVLQHQQAQMVRPAGETNPFMHTHLPSQFLLGFDSFRSWRIDIDRRLSQWKESAPTRRETGVQFSTDFLDLNYWQCVIMLYRQSLSVPAVFEGEFNTSDEVESPGAQIVELREDEERVFLKVAEAGQKVLRLYRSLHRLHLVNYTFLATHHLFMAGISFLYAIWHSPTVRSRLTLDEVDFTILAATSVLGDLIEKCPPAEACRDAFDRMSKATVQMCMSTTGFSSSVQGLSSSSRPKSEQSHDPATDYMNSVPSSSSQFATSNARNIKPISSNRNQRPTSGGQGFPQQSSSGARPVPQFDMGLNDLFPTQSNQMQDIQSSQGYRQVQQSNSNMNNNSRNIKMEYPSDAYGMSRSSNTIPSPSEYSTGSSAHRESVLDTSNAAIDPSLLPSPRQGYFTDPNVGGYRSAGSGSTNPGPSNNSSGNGYDLDSAFPMSNIDLDFMQTGAGGMPLDGTQTGGVGGGMDLGFGIGWEGMDHDFSEGNQVDLFDGFFFGGTGAGAGAGF